MFPPAPLAIISRLRLSALTSLAHSLQIRVQGWDPLYIISQIVSLQSLHYLTLSFFLPTLLYFFASPVSLEYAGGPSSISMIMDWREFLGASVSSRDTAAAVSKGGIVMVETLVGLGQSEMGTGVGINYAVGTREMVDGLVRLTSSDPSRGWVIAAGWILACLLDIIYLYHIVRRPTHILDSSLTLLFNHLILTTYYSGHFPTAIFFWLVVILSTVAQIVLAEQWCVRREMRDGFKSGSSETRNTNGEIDGARGFGGDEEVEMGKFGHTRGNGNSNGGSTSRQYERVPNMEA